MRRRADLEQDIIHHLQFVKVSTTHDGQPSNVQQSGHLTATSCKMLIVELERYGYRITKAQSR
jgi:hypothetical protein